MPKKPQQLAKLSRPRIYDALPRERLFRLLDQNCKHPAVWVSGPPGAGKTTLIASYLESRQLPGIWYHVDSGDADASTFFYYLTEAAKAFPSRKPLPLLTPEYLPDLHGFTRRFFRDLYRRLPGNAVVVLDNFQEVSEDAIQLVISLAISETPENAHLVVISRTEPGAACSKLLANKDLVQLGWNDLRLNIEEAGAIAQSRARLDEQAFRQLFNKSGGWVAGLTLMLERLRRGDLAESDVESVSREVVFDYFAAQIFDGANAETREALLKTSIFSSFSLRAAEGVSGNPRIGKILDNLCQRQLFTYRRGTDLVRYQYHDLFREFLAGRLEREMAVDRRRQLMREGAATLLREDMAEEALPLLLKGQDWIAAAEVTGKLAPALLAQGRFRTLSDWITAQGDDRVRKNGWLLYWLGNACMQQEIGKAVALLRQALERFRDEGNAIGKCLCAAELIRAQYYQYDDFAPLDEWILLLDELFAVSLEFPDAASEMKVCSALVLALGARQPGHPRLQAVLSRTSELLDADIEVNQKVAAGMALFSHFTISNQLPKAQHIIDRLAPLSASSEVTALNRAYWWLQLGYHHFRQSEIADAEQAWERSDKFIEEHGLRQTDFVGRCFRAFHYAALYDYGRGQAVLAGLEKGITETRPSTGALYHLARCLLEMSMEHGAEAAYHGRLALANALRVGRPFYTVAWSAHAAAALAMAGDFKEADRLVEEGWNASQGTFLEGYRCSLLMARAYLSLRQGLTQRSHDAIRELVRIGREHGSWTYLRTDPTVKDVVLEEALVAGIEVPFVQMVVRRFGMRPRRQDIEAWPWPVKIRTLGEFRIEIDGETLTFSRKAPKKPIALLKAVIAFGGRNVPEQRLLDALWPDEAGDAAHEAFAVSLHRLRKLLVHADVVQLLDGLVSLDAGKCWVDAWALERRIAETDAQPGGTDASGANPVWQLYRGHFLAEDTDAPWAVSMRERLRSQFLMHLSRSGKRHEKEGRLDVATLLYQKGIDSDDLAEELYQGLMRCHLQQDRRAEAMAVYRRLRQTLSVTLGIQPSPQSEQLFRSIKDE